MTFIALPPVAAQSSVIPSPATGDVVRVRDPSVFDKTFSAKVRERDATVLWVGVLLGCTTPSVKLRFHQRGNRGKEFVSMLRAADVVKAAAVVGPELL